LLHAHLIGIAGLAHEFAKRRMRRPDQHASCRPVFYVLRYMARKQRGRPANGQYPVTAVRLPPELKSKVGTWANRQKDKPSLSKAIRQLLENALAGTAAPSQSDKGRTRLAANLAAREIDQLGDKAATGEERASRKRRLLSGPKEFRDMRRK
jgi:hypothetical protein